MSTTPSKSVTGKIRPPGCSALKLKPPASPATTRPAMSAKGVTGTTPKARVAPGLVLSVKGPKNPAAPVSTPYVSRLRAPSQPTSKSLPSATPRAQNVPRSEVDALVGPEKAPVDDAPAQQRDTVQGASGAGTVETPHLITLPSAQPTVKFWIEQLIRAHEEELPLLAEHELHALDQVLSHLAKWKEAEDKWERDWAARKAEKLQVETEFAALGITINMADPVLAKMRKELEQADAETDRHHHLGSQDQRQLFCMIYELMQEARGAAMGGV